MKSSGGMALIQTNKQLRDVAFTLRNLFKSGYLSVDQILIEAGSMAPEMRSAFHAASKQVSNHGSSFSEAVKHIFPEREMAAIRAGDRSGKLFAVFDQMWQTSKTQEEIDKVMRGINTPLALIIIGIIVSIGFSLMLVPTMVKNMAGSVRDFQPSAAVQFSMDAQLWVLENKVAAFSSVAILFFAIAAVLANRSYREKISAYIISKIIKIKPIGIAYANLKFGFTAKYLEIVSVAGLDMSERIELVTDLIPLPIRLGMDKFKEEFIMKGLKEASRSENRPDDDPRGDPVQWPPYFRLAIAQAHESGVMEEPMREYGVVLIDDGKERLQTQIKVLTTAAMAIAGLLILVPVGLMYGTMGEILMMRMSQL